MYPSQHNKFPIQRRYFALQGGVLHFENAVRLAVSLGGDSDTIACITGGIAEAFYQTIPDHIAEMSSIILGPDLMLDVVIPFSEKYRK